ncbi:hypothetical protein ACNFU2_11130 [Chryseobacterium sp. PTM-20240506]|uniref:hypothetical protein n=1 Tax=unclassified Chryseobacterium TaxID=2593645 RepID=UPI0015538BC2|nr:MULTISPECIES: hypothetical protein [unclassified Chryseobacterium]MDC8105449.1 hypothetical protein [Chryseobacterium sp. B21-037]MDQ1805704.1 hypothetical protein [Chryseobacterium sp. CKR4-1]WBV58864.1 hypothetical protein PFY10_10435 [Chryseobacterium daecheongense]
MKTKFQWNELSREVLKNLLAGSPGEPAYCVSDTGPGEGGCNPGYICENGKCVPYNPSGGGSTGGGTGGGPTGPTHTCYCGTYSYVTSDPCPYTCFSD